MLLVLGEAVMAPGELFRVAAIKAVAHAQYDLPVANPSDVSLR
jgi:hypothetical protein